MGEQEMIEIRHKITEAVLFKSETATTVKMAVEEAVKSKADLRFANLSEANLSEANLLYCKMTKKVFKQITEGWFEWEISD